MSLERQPRFGLLGQTRKSRHPREGYKRPPSTGLRGVLLVALVPRVDFGGYGYLGVEVLGVCRYDPGDDGTRSRGYVGIQI